MHKKLKRRNCKIFHDSVMSSRNKWRKKCYWIFLLQNNFCHRNFKTLLNQGMVTWPNSSLNKKNINAKKNWFARFQGDLYFLATKFDKILSNYPSISANFFTLPLIIVVTTKETKMNLTKIRAAEPN